ncbi:polyribonucleotide nucleotidyltransferase [Desulfatibacillum aliphaticivorans]|uniref:polyribonucleotide nucleotidyltransferase n=1 Tax=Desulfatibacillum aliphaticivorans TaxID=218208 RepID=UPI0003FABCC3|nr:polyribonucleotide nucleotidyltransferase [Desulfatibacillum aliphaticivorans]
MEVTLERNLGDKPLRIQTGKLAKQASGSVVVSYGETITLVTVVGSQELRPGIDFVPLSVEYQEKVYAAGRIPGNYFRREIGRPSEKETLTARLIDRPIRPLFPKTWRYETQVIATVLSMDQENDPDMLSMVGASAALCISDLPFFTPIACVRVGRIDGELVANPTISQQENCDLNIIVAGSRDGVVMVEGGGQFISEEEMLDAIYFGQESLEPLLEMQEELMEKAGVPKRSADPVEKDEDLAAKVAELADPEIKKALEINDKLERQDAIRDVKKTVMEGLGEEYEDRGKEVSEFIHDRTRVIMRAMVLDEGRRIGGRRFDEVRPITCEVGILPRTHGSALFTRGETQSLGILTLGSSGDEQRVETLYGDETRPFMLHYNFPPYSVREVKRISGPSRRDIGHGGLSTRAIKEVLPSKEDFDYTIRIVSEILESNGSSSMATVCSASLALMDGGVPITNPVSGIAMGLMAEGDKIVVLSDILGDEDHMGDMDFKVAGTKDGITSVQMDIKISSLTREIMEKALAQARVGRLHILEKMLTTISESREEMSPYAPKVFTIQIHPDKIRDIIGPGGKVIRAIQAETGTRVDVDDSGLVKVSAVNLEEGEAALQMIKDITAVPEVGAVYEGTVVKIMDFGAFVAILPGTEGLCHISQLDTKHVKKVSDVVKEGEKIKVKVLELTKDGKIRLSRKALLEEENGKSGPENGAPQRDKNRH